MRLGGYTTNATNSSGRRSENEEDESYPHRRTNVVIGAAAGGGQQRTVATTTSNTSLLDIVFPPTSIVARGIRVRGGYEQEEVEDRAASEVDTDFVLSILQEAMDIIDATDFDALERSY